MSISKRTLIYYTLQFSSYQNGRETILNQNNLIRDFYNSYLNLLNHGRLNIKKELSENKFFLLDESITYNNNYFYGYFISAKTHHKPNLIDENTLNIRENPKHLTEGEEEKTHFVIKIDNSTNQLIILLESRNTGITINKIASYIKKILNNNNLEYNYNIIPRDNFFDELLDLRRVKIGKIYLNKQIIGSEFLNFTELSDDAKEEVFISISANRNKSIKDNIIEIARKFIDGSEQTIRKIEIEGIDDSNNPIILNTEQVQLKKYINARLNDITNIVDSEDILTQMKNILEEF